jgi:hypothetical protein
MLQESRRMIERLNQKQHEEKADQPSRVANRLIETQNKSKAIDKLAFPQSQIRRSSILTANRYFNSVTRMRRLIAMVSTVATSSRVTDRPWDSLVPD